MSLDEHAERLCKALNIHISVLLRKITRLARIFKDVRVVLRPIALVRREAVKEEARDLKHLLLAISEHFLIYDKVFLNLPFCRLQVNVLWILLDKVANLFTPNQAQLVLVFQCTYILLDFEVVC